MSLGGPSHKAVERSGHDQKSPKVADDMIEAEFYI
jgi:hypothetical protein